MHGVHVNMYYSALNLLKQQMEYYPQGTVEMN